jgi:hypothetical protein
MGANLQAWHDVVAMVADIHLTNQRDCFVYRALLEAEAISYNTLIWKLKLPLKIKVFIWYLYKRVTLTKDNLARRQWQGDMKCCFYSSNEFI